MKKEDMAKMYSKNKLEIWFAYNPYYLRPSRVWDSDFDATDVKAMFRIIIFEVIKCILKNVLMVPKIKYFVYIAKNMIVYKSDLQ